MDERDAIEQLKQGKLDGLKFLVEQYYSQAVHTAWLILQDRAAAEDIVQNAFIQAGEHISQLRSPQFAPWFMRMVVNHSLRWLSRERRLLPLNSDDELEPEKLAYWLMDPSPLPEETAITHQLQDQIRMALSKLHPSQRAVLVMKYYLDFSETEIAQTVHQSPSTIKWRLYTARQKLRSWLSADQPVELNTSSQTQSSSLTKK